VSRSAINPVAFGISREAIREGLNTLVVGGRAYDVRKSTYPSSSNSTFTVGSLGPARKYVSGNATADRYSAPHLQVAGSRPGSLLCVWSPLTLNAADRYLLTSGLTLSTAGSGLSISTTKTAARAVNSSYVNVEVYTDAPTIGATYVSVLTAGDYLRLYHFGRLIGEAAIAGGGPRTTTAAKTISIGSTDASTSNYVGANIFLAAEFDAEIPAAYALSLSQDPWQILTPPTRKGIFVWGANAEGGDTTITCTVANAVASGATAAVNLSLATTPANAVASGATAAVNLSLATTPANAVAAGTTAAVNLSLVTTPANAVASGVSANLDGSVTVYTTPANAVASGVSAAVNLSLATTPANAVASGVSAAVNLSLATTPANAVASGVSAAVNLSLATTPANAVASGVSAAVNLSLATTPANAVASGISASLNGSVTVYTTPANAVASGVTALITGPVSVICAVGAAVAAGVTCIVTGGSTSEVDVVYLRSALTRTVNLQSAIG
jgi:hypothetical protein